MKQISVNSLRYRIEIEFPYSLGLVQRVKQLPDRSWDAENKVWHLPLTQTHAVYAVRFGQEHGFSISKQALDLSRASLKRVNIFVRDNLYEFQTRALDFLHQSGGRAILADEMGLGKTVTTLSWIQECDFSRVLVVSPASVIYNWEKEINKWLKGWSVQVITDGKTEISQSKIVIMSYALFVKYIDRLLDDIFDLVVYDECHYLANPKSQRTRAAMRFHTSHFLGLSGTPFLNRPIELYPLLNMVSPTVWKSRFKYGLRYCGGHRNYFGWDFSGATNLPELKEKTKAVLLRRTKMEVLKDLPPMTRTLMPVVIDNQTDYNRELREAIQQARKSKASKLTVLANLRQIIGLGKVKSAIELAEDVLSSKDKVVLFAHHKSVVSELENGLKKYGVLKIVGDTDKKERQEFVDTFAAGNDHRVMIISLAGGEGINLQVADTLIFVEREWNPGKEGQIEGRLHRIGQSNSVQIIYLIARGTIDDRINKIIEQKREVMGQIISLDDIPLEEILEL